MTTPNTDHDSLLEAIEQYSVVPPDRRGDLVTRLLQDEEWRCSKKGVWHGPNGITLGGYLTFVAPTEIPHLLAPIESSTKTGTDAGANVRNPEGRPTTPEAHRLSLMTRLNAANGCKPNYGFDD